MWLREKKTGRVCDAIVREKRKDDGSYSIIVCTIKKHGCGSVLAEYYSLAKLYEEWEDYKPVADPIFDDEKVSKAIRAWLSIQVQPIEAVSILCSKDSDGFFSYHLYGYIAKARIADGKAVVNNNLLAIGFDFRSDVFFEHKRGHDYAIPELCGEEEKCS